MDFFHFDSEFPRHILLGNVAGTLSLHTLGLWAESLLIVAAIFQKHANISLEEATPGLNALKAVKITGGKVPQACPCIPQTLTRHLPCPNTRGCPQIPLVQLGGGARPSVVLIEG